MIVKSIEDIESKTDKKIANHFNLLSRKIEHLTAMIISIQDKEIQKNIIANIRYKELIEEVEQLENFLSKSCKYGFSERGRNTKEYKLFDP